MYKEAEDYTKKISKVMEIAKRGCNKDCVTYHGICIAGVCEAKEFLSRLDSMINDFEETFTCMTTSDEEADKIKNRVEMFTEDD